MATTPSGPADPGASPYLGTGGGTTEAALGAFPHYVEGLDEPELAPAVPEERPELPREELDAQLEANTEKLREPDEQHVTEVVNSLVGMSDAQRKEALADLSDEEFDAMMDNLPPGEHEKLNELVGATDDPKRKLRVWGAAERAELSREGRNLDQVPHSTEHVGEEEVILARRMAAVDDGKEEVTDEVDHATAQLDDPNLSDEDKKKIVD